MKLGVLFSGGKDSALAWTLAAEHHDVVCLISIISKNPDSYMFHTPNSSWTALQAKAAGIPLIQKETEGRKEDELNELKSAIEEMVKKYEIEGIVTGAVHSTYQASRVQRICHELGLWCFNPLWLMDQVELLQEVQDRGIKAIISAVASEPFTTEWLGRPIDKQFITDIQKIKHLTNPAGEGGEFESFVIEMPLFRERIHIISAETTYHNFQGKYKITKAELE